MKNLDTLTNEPPTLEEYKDLVARNVSKLEKKTFEEFWLSRAKLEIDGYKYVGQKPNDEQSYQKQLATETQVPELQQRIRQTYNFKNCAEETIYQYTVQGYEIVLITPSFDVEENLVDKTSFFVKKKGADQQELLKKIKSLEEEAQKNYDLYLRTCAEMKNTTTRLRKEKEEHTKYANASLIKEILPTIDNLYRTIEHSKKDQSLSPSFVQGAELVLNNLLSMLRKQGLEEVKAVGELFNPEFHEAVSMQPSDETPKGYVLQELQKGYILNSRLLRPSAVIISKGKE